MVTSGTVVEGSLHLLIIYRLEVQSSSSSEVSKKIDSVVWVIVGLGLALLAGIAVVSLIILRVISRRKRKAIEEGSYSTLSRQATEDAALDLKDSISVPLADRRVIEFNHVRLGEFIGQGSAGIVYKYASFQ